ncbi:MAG: hypothetical protein H7249_20530 [Chitinophagaceae bacterium]|nr:hypothetical protein [Oligoflexus sp.]
MKLYLLSLILILSSCKQYVPPGAIASSTKSTTSLATSRCDSKNVVFALQEASSVAWSVAQIDTNAKGPLSSKNPASGQISLVKGQLNQAKGLITFNIGSTSTGDPIRDRLLQEVLFGMSTLNPFRVNINRLIGSSTSVATGATVTMQADGTLELGGRKSSLLFPISITESGGIYLLKGTIVVNARDTRPALNTISLNDKFQTIETTLNSKLGSTLTLTFDLHMKNTCT